MISDSALSLFVLFIVMFSKKERGFIQWKTRSNVSIEH